ncbi:MAG TPA: ABC transporter permease, partial [Candidatus Dormibacteraeota bacterium]
LDPATAPAAVATRVRDTLGPVAATADPRGGVDEPLSQLQPLLALVVVLSVILGAGVSANSIAVSAVERRRDTGLLRVAGASRRQVLGLFASETALIALVGAGFGLVAGVGLAALLVHVAAAPDLPAPALAPGPGQLGTALAAGFGAAFAGASIPALAAARLPALRALRSRPGGERERPLRGSAAAALACWGAAAVLLLVDRAAPVAAGVVLALLGLALLLPIIAPALLRGLAALLSPLLPRAPVAAANLARRRNRSGLVLGVLTISVAAAVALASLTSGAMAAGNEWVGHLFAGDTVLVSPATARDEVAGQISASAGVAVGRLRFLSAPVDGLIVAITAADLEPYVDHGGLDLVEGDRSAALEHTGRAPAVIVPQQLADRYGWHLGHVLRLDPGSGGAAVALTVAGVAAHTFPGGDGRESLIMGHDQAVLALGPVAAGFDDLQVLGGSTRAGDLQTVAGSFGMQATAVADIQDAARRSLDHSLQLLAALGWLGVVVAMLAVINTLVVNARQGTRELALLRAVGLSRRHALRLVLVEAALLGAAGVLVGSLAGCAVALPMLRVSASSGFAPHFDPPLTVIAALTILVVVGAMLAAYLPARRVVGTAIVGAIRYE